MKFQDSSFNGLKVTVGTKSVTQAPTNARSKSNMPHQLFQSWGHKKPGAIARWVAMSLGNQEAPRSILASGTSLREDLVMKIFLRPFFLFC